MSRRNFTRDYKIETVRQIVGRGVSASQAAREVGIRQNVLSRWIKEFGIAAEKANGAKSSGKQKSARRGAALVGNGAELTEVQRLRRELRRITSERDTLKKAIVYLARDGQQPVA